VKNYSKLNDGCTDTITVYELSQDSTQVGDECPICFDEFEEGNL
jgi:hypothetical protein